jgi:2-dehydropantoate 2-reductase
MTNIDIHTPQSSTERLRIVVAGLGALGTLIAWHCRFEALFTHNRRQQTEFSLQTSASASDTPPQVDTFSAPLWRGEEADWLIITTKAAATLEIFSDLKDHLKNTSRILLLQNGMGQQEEASAWLKQNRISAELWVASSTEGAYKADSGTVIYAGKGQTVAGRWQLSGETAKAQLPPSMKLATDIKQVLHEKLAINAIINPLTAHYRCRNGELLTSTGKHSDFKALSIEVATLFKELNWKTGFDIQQQAAKVAEATAQNQSSTFQDVLHQRRTELPYICGYLLQHARQNGLNAPLTESLYQSISALEAAW